MNIFDKVLAEHWQEWYTLYVDDLGVHGATKLQVETRARVLEAILTIMEKPFSDKTGDDVCTSLDMVFRLKVLQAKGIEAIKKLFSMI